MSGDHPEGAAGCLLLQALCAPQSLATLTAAQWTTLVQQALGSGLLGRLAGRLQGLASPMPVPSGMAGHLAAALRVGRAQQLQIEREARFIDHALADLGAPVLLLKGAAYVLAGLPAAQGRVFSDIDILVPKSHLARAESLLTIHGGMGTDASAYNQRDYRQWMHELPPMQHVQRGTVLDLHHNILPETARLRPDPALLTAAARPLAGSRLLHTLAPLDMVLHGMTHLFMNDDMGSALRDLSDLDILLRHFGAEPGFWPALVPRAAALDLGRPLFHALRQVQRSWGTPVPPGLAQPMAQQAPPRALLALMDAIWSRVFLPPQGLPANTARQAALAALLVRGHWLRMPPWMLAQHLTVKALGLHKPRVAPSSPVAGRAG